MHVQRIAIGFIAFTTVIGCGKKSDSPSSAAPEKPKLPELTDALMPAALGGLKLMTSTEADVIAKFPSAKLGTMTFNDMPSDTMSVDEPHLQLATTPRGKDGKLFRFELAADGVCDWVKTNIGALDGAKRCPGNRKTGEMGGESLYCARLGDRQVVRIECTRNATFATRDDGTKPPPRDLVEYMADLAP